ncbi:hypothetical protein L6452_40218 [Arctium lappa]|uniref:Uncharacterized protein n=1 Tax=Arctium lappa TaxID=4217 RepID=A0ACB8XLJ9_ARCLA|nr:hypothetical protein L6452_40218 [Arctium lappa]
MHMVYQCCFFVRHVAIVDGPEIVVPNVVGIRSGTLSKSVSHNVVYVVGEEAWAHHGFTIIHSIQHGRIRNFEAMKRVWEHVFYEKLQIDPEECALIITKPAIRFEGESERMVSEMFNEFRFKSLLLVVAPLLTMFGNVHTDGIVIDIGEGLTQVVPIYEEMLCIVVL